MTGTATNYIALIPAYEPDLRLLGIIRDLNRAGFEIVVVDDGSGEDYSEIFAAAAERATVLTHSVNRGKGAALKTGLGYIHRYKISGGCLNSVQKADSENTYLMSVVRTVVVTVDADGQHLAKDALRIARAAAGHRNSLVLGSRALEEDVPLRSKLGNTITRQVYRLSTGISVHDTQTGLRAFGSELIPRLLEINGDRYEYEINMLMEFAAEGIPIYEEEIETIYHDNNETSHFNTVKDSARIYKEILKFSASSFIGFLVDYGMYALLLFLTAKTAGYGAAGAFLATNSLVIANVGARIVSSVTNYTINRNLVFRSKTGVARSAVQYFMLAALILVGNTAVLGTLVSNFGMNRMLAKVITEVIFFAISWTVQKYVIFFKEAEETEQAAGCINMTRGLDRK